MSDEDIQDIIENKIEDLNDEQRQLNENAQVNYLLGQKLIYFLQHHGTEEEVEKLLLHISQMEKVTNLLMLLTHMLARLETRKDSDSQDLRVGIPDLISNFHKIFRT